MDGEHAEDELIPHREIDHGAEDDGDRVGEQRIESEPAGEHCHHGQVSTKRDRAVEQMKTNQSIENGPSRPGRAIPPGPSLVPDEVVQKRHLDGDGRRCQIVQPGPLQERREHAELHQDTDASDGVERHPPREDVSRSHSPRNASSWARRAQLLVGAVFIASAPVTAQMSKPQTACQDLSPRLERLGKGVERGEVDLVLEHLAGGGDVNETWRDTRMQICRSLLCRSVTAGQEQIFRLLLERGADHNLLPSYALFSPIERGDVEMVRTLLALGVSRLGNDEILSAALRSGRVEMLDLVLSSGVSIDPATLPVHYLTDDIARYLVPRHLGPNTETPVGNEACAFEELFGLMSPMQDGCEGTVGPVWLHFVATGRYDMVRYMIAQGANLTTALGVSAVSGRRVFTANDIATARKDRPMLQLLQRAARR